jgi:hypothetical protein
MRVKRGGRPRPRAVADDGSAITKTIGCYKMELGSFTCWGHEVVC